MLRHVWEFIVAVAHRLGVLTTGGVVVALIGFSEHFSGRPITGWPLQIAVAMSLVCAFFSAWRQERLKVETLNALIVPQQRRKESRCSLCLRSSFRMEARRCFSEKSTRLSAGLSPRKSDYGDGRGREDPKRDLLGASPRNRDAAREAHLLHEGGGPDLRGRVLQAVDVRHVHALSLFAASSYGALKLLSFWDRDFEVSEKFTVLARRLGKPVEWLANLACELFAEDPPSEIIIIPPPDLAGLAGKRKAPRTA